MKKRLEFFELQFNKGYGWRVSSLNISECTSLYLIQDIMRKAVKKRPDCDYRIISFYVVKYTVARKKYSFEEDIARTAANILSRISK